MEIEDEPIGYWRPESIVTLYWVFMFLLFLVDVGLGVLILVMALNPFSPVVVAVVSVLVIFNLATFGVGVAAGLVGSKPKLLTTYMWMKGLYIVWMYVSLAMLATFVVTMGRCCCCYCCAMVAFDCRAFH
jgi:hypothetical protein